MQTLNLKQLEAYCAVVEHGGFTAAAEALYMAQSTVSGHVAALEKELGTALFVRSGAKRGTLTEEGQRVYAHANTILQSCEELRRELDEASSREITLAASSIPMQYVLPPLIARYAKTAPEVRFTLRGGDSEQVHEAVLRGEAQLGFVGAVLDVRSLRYDRIAVDPLMLVTPDTPAYREKLAAGVPGNELLTEPLLFREGGSGTQLAGQRFLTENGIDTGKLRIVARIGNSEALLRAVECGLGCAVVSGLAARSGSRVLAFPLVGKNTERELYMIRPRDRRLTPAVRGFAAAVLKETE